MRICFQLVAFVREHIWHKASLMGYSMRLELTCVCSLNDFLLVIGLCSGHPLFFFECVYLNLLYSSLIFDMFFRCVCVCVCVCVGVILDFTNSYFYHVCVSVCLGDFCVCVCMCGLKFTGNFFLTVSVCVYIYTYRCMFVYIYIYIYIQCITKVSTPLIFLQIFKYISHISTDI